MLRGPTRSATLAFAASVLWALENVACGAQFLDRNPVGFDERFAGEDRAVPIFARQDIAKLFATSIVPAREELASSGASAGQLKPLNRPINSPEGNGSAEVRPEIPPETQDVASAPAPTARPPSQPQAPAAEPAQEVAPSVELTASQVPSAFLRTLRDSEEPAQAAATRAEGFEASQGPGTTGAVDTGRWLGTGRASWYQHPGRTAGGEVYDPDQFTAAHRSLPFGTRLRVVKQPDGRSVVVRINDRLSHKANVLIDLSRASARAIGMTGIVQVTLYQLGEPAGRAREPSAASRSEARERMVAGKASPASRREQTRRAIRSAGIKHPRRVETQARAPQGGSGTSWSRFGRTAARGLAGGHGPRLDKQGTPPIATIRTEASPAVSISLPQNLAPKGWTPSQRSAFAPDLGWVRGPEEALRTLREPLAQVPKELLGPVSLCGSAIFTAARPRGAVLSEATSAGRARRTGAIVTAPIEARLIYSGFMIDEVRRAQVSCQLDQAGRVIGLEPL